MNDAQIQIQLLNNSYWTQATTLSTKTETKTNVTISNLKTKNVLQKTKMSTIKIDQVAYLIL